MGHNYDDLIMDTGSCVAYWRLDGDVDTWVNKALPNLSGNAPTGYPYPNLLPAANNLYSTHFDGSSKYLTATYNQWAEGLDFSLTENFTVECWVKPTADQSASDVIGIAQKPGAFGLYLAYGKATFFTQAEGESSRTTVTDSNTLSINTVHHLVGTYQNNVLTGGGYHGLLSLYVDGSLVGTTTRPVGDAIDHTGVTNFSIGSWDTSTLFFEGYISNVALYGGALSSTYVSDHYGYSG